jgi:SAM-dependent methyltransferase
MLRRRWLLLGLEICPARDGQAEIIDRFSFEIEIWKIRCPAASKENPMTQTPTPIHDVVREHYAERIKSNTSCCGPDSSCCSSDSDLYPADLLTTLPEGESAVSYGCGDPITLASLQPGQTVLDLGSGAGLDCFFAARKVGETGHVIGVDMTPEMIERASSSAQRLGLANVEFRQGFIEDLPVESGSVDVTISNCVINLAPDKSRVFADVFRVLKPGGRLAVSDIVTGGPLPEPVKQSLSAWAGCVAGAVEAKDYIAMLESAGFSDISVVPVFFDREDVDSALKDLGDLPELNVIDPEELYRAVFSAKITAWKPG